MSRRMIVLAAAVIIVIILLVVYYYMSTTSSSSTTTSSTPSTTSSTTAPTYTYTTQNGVIYTGALPPCTGTLNSGYCILTGQSAAQAACNANPSCTGYGQANGSSSWMANYPNGYQLYTGTSSTPNSQWTSYIKTS